MPDSNGIVYVRNDREEYNPSTSRTWCEDQPGAQDRYEDESRYRQLRPA